MMFIAILMFTGCKKNSEKIKINSEMKSGTELSKLSIQDKAGENIASLLVEIARDDYTRTKGLMFREDMPSNQGMLFVFDEEEVRYFWMRNTAVSLDMMFCDSEYEIVHIEKYTRPYSDQTYSSNVPARYVLETVAGFTDLYHIRPGFRLILDP